MRKLIRSTFALLMLALIGLPMVGSAASAPATVNSGITVTPALLNFRLSKDAPDQSIDVSITNNYDAAVQLTAEFKGIDEAGGRLIPTNDIDVPFNQALHVSSTDIILAPHQVFPLKVQLQNTPTLTAGGHYATLVLTQQANDSRAVPLRAQLSIGIFGIKTAGAHQAIKVQSVHTNHWIFHLPSQATITYTNPGNVYVVPRAAVQLNRINSAEPVVSGISNDTSRPLFPGNTLRDIAPLHQQQHIWWPIRLQQTVSYRFDGADSPTVLTTYIWYIPLLYPLILLALLAYATWRWRAKLSKLFTTIKSRRTPSKPPVLLPAQTVTRPKHYIAIDDSSAATNVPLKPAKSKKSTPVKKAKSAPKSSSTK